MIELTRLDELKVELADEEAALNTEEMLVEQSYKRIETKKDRIEQIKEEMRKEGYKSEGDDFSGDPTASNYVEL